MTTPHYRSARPRPALSEVEKLAARLDDAAHTLHSRFEFGYGSLTGPQPNLPRSLPARLRLLVEGHLHHALTLLAPGTDVYLEYGEADAALPIDEPDARPTGITIVGKGGEPITVGLGWPSRGCKTLRFEQTAGISDKPVVVMLGGPDAGEMLVATVAGLISAAVVALGAGGELESA